MRASAAASAASAASANVVAVAAADVVATTATPAGDACSFHGMIGDTRLLNFLGQPASLERHFFSRFWHQRASS